MHKYNICNILTITLVIKAYIQIIFSTLNKVIQCNALNARICKELRNYTYIYDLFKLSNYSVSEIKAMNKSLLISTLLIWSHITLIFMVINGRAPI